MQRYIHETNPVTEPQNRGLKFAYFLLGIALPMAGYFVWSRTIGESLQRKKRKNQLQEIAVEDSFPASDPPASW
jgi:hypothetical protein